MISGNTTTSTTEKFPLEKSDFDNEHIFPTMLNDEKKPLQDDTVSKIDADGRYRYVYMSLGANETSVKLTQLKHFSAYTIHVKACRYGPLDNCSVETSTPAMTKKMSE